MRASSTSLPYRGRDSLGLGKPLKSILHGRADLPLYLAAIGPKNVELAAELADGWLPIFFAPEHYKATFAEAVAAGRARAGEAGRPEGFDIAPAAAVVVGDDLAGCWMQLKPMLALYIGGMGSRGRNFYYNSGLPFTVLKRRLTGSRRAIWPATGAGAVQAVPDALVDAISLCGSRARNR